MHSKVCPKCGIEKPLSGYSKCSARKHLDGVRYECKSCAVLARQAWAEKNREKTKEYDKKYYDKDKRVAQVKRWREENPDKHAASVARYLETNAERIREVRARYVRENRDAILQKARRRYAAAPTDPAIRKARYWENREESLRYSKEFKKKNRALCNAWSANRKAAKKNASPPWLTKAHKIQIEQFYEAAYQLTVGTGVPHQVDHIVPLQGKTVCGLHVPWNLQILTASENASKGNSHKD